MAHAGGRAANNNGPPLAAARLPKLPFRSQDCASKSNNRGMRMRQRRAVMAASILAVAFSAKALAATPDAQADALVNDFVYESLALAPATATFAGYHVHKGVRLDSLWDDYSQAGIARERRFNLGLWQRLDALRGAAIDAERQADLDMVRDAVGLNLLELDHIQAYRHNPTFYVELIGNGLYNLYVLNSAPEEQRFGYIIKRLQRLPVLVSQARANLMDSPEVWNRVAREENDGNIELIDKTLRAATPTALKTAYSAAATSALKSLREFNDHLARTLSRKTSDWRLGAENYRQKCAFYWVTPIPGDWPQARIDSKLREYNHYTLHQLTVHEAMPGHYVQAEYANRIEPPARRVLRNIWGNNAYIEGWAVYAQQMMTDEGYLDNDPKMRLAMLKQMMRGEANTILDIRLQTMGMTDSQALDLMIKQTYQEREEATAKLQRAQLSTCQLAVYYAGSHGWNA